MMSSDTLGVMLSMEVPDIQTAIKETLPKKKTLMQPGLQNRALQNSAVSSPESVRISQLAHACQGPTR